MPRIQLPFHLRNLAKIQGEVSLDIPAPITTNAILTALEQSYPVLQGTLRDHDTKKRRPMIRFYAEEQDLSHDDPDTPLPESIATGQKPFLIIGAIAGG
jgi:hypothetical protein